MILVLAFSAIILTSCQQAATVTGTVRYVEQIQLPSNAAVIIRLEQDVSRTDAPSVIIAEQTIKNPGQVPIHFEIQYDPADINERHMYVIRARIMVNEELMFANTMRFAVITHGNPTEVEVIVRKVR